MNTLFTAIKKIWSIPAILIASFLITWAAEASQYFISQGLALAILALLQTLPEFAVEAQIAWHQDTHLMLANLTGSLRLIVGLGWPLIFFTRAFFLRKKYSWSELKVLKLKDEDSISILLLLLPLLYFLIVLFKKNLFFYDAIILTVFYIFYLWLLNKLPPQDSEEISQMPYVPRKILSFSPFLRNFAILFLFVAGALLLLFSVHPFIESMMSLALYFGIPSYLFIQWMAPFLSEFPEKLAAFNWAKQDGKANLALMNMLSSNFNQWTLLVALMLGVYCYSKQQLTGFYFDEHQLSELWLTWTQALLSWMMLLNLEFIFAEALFLFLAWLLQFCIPSIRYEISLLYLIAAAFYFIRYLSKRKILKVFKIADDYHKSFCNTRQ